MAIANTGGEAGNDGMTRSNIHATAAAASGVGGSILPAGLQGTQNGLMIAPIGIATAPQNPSAPLLVPQQPQPPPPTQPAQLLSQPLHNRLHSLAPITPAVPQQQVLPATMTFAHPHAALAGALHMQLPPLGLLPAHPDPVALMNASKTTQTPPVFRNMKLRSGKWTDEEEQYADLLIELFEKAHIEEKNGCTLRSFLSRKLHCAPMRISKKYAGKGIGKMVFLSKKNISGYHGISAATLANSAARLRDAETKFYKAVLPESSSSKFENQTTAGQLVRHTPPLLNGLTPIVPATSVPATAVNFSNNPSGVGAIVPHQLPFPVAADNATGAPTTMTMMPQPATQPTGRSYFIQPGTYLGVPPLLQPGAQTIVASESRPGVQPALRTAQTATTVPSPQAATLTTAQNLMPQSTAIRPPAVPQDHSHPTLQSASSVSGNQAGLTQASMNVETTATDAKQATVLSASANLMPVTTQPNGPEQNEIQKASQAGVTPAVDSKPIPGHNEVTSNSDPSSSLEPSHNLSHHARQLHQTYLSVLQNMRDEDKPSATVQLNQKEAPTSDTIEPECTQQTPQGNGHAFQPDHHSPAKSTAVNRATLSVNPSNHEMPDFLSGFDKVAAATGGNQNQALPAQVNDEYSPPFTSRSFDDFHRFLGNLSPLAASKTPAINLTGNGAAFSASLAAAPGEPVVPTAGAQHLNNSTLPQTQQQQELIAQQAAQMDNSKANSLGSSPSPFGADAYNMFAQQSAFAASLHSAYTPQWRSAADHAHDSMIGLQKLKSGQTPMTTLPLDCRRAQASNVVSEPSNASGSTGGSSSESGGDNSSDNTSNDSDGASSESSVRKKMRISYTKSSKVTCEGSSTNP